jgi:hypothetical protein
MKRITLLLLTLLQFALIYSCGNPENSFNQARKLNTVKAFSDFISKYPDNFLVSSAESLICSLNLDTALKKNSVTSLLVFVKNNSKCFCCDTAIKKIKEYKKTIMSEEKQFISEFTEYDQFERIWYIALKNINGSEVAKKVFEYNNYNGMLISKIVIISLPSQDTIATIIYDMFGEPIKNKYICLDIEGNILKENGKPIIVDAFKARQKSTFNRKYNGSFVVSEVMKSYPCLNCDDETGKVDCFYIW